ncbi:MAG: molybdenum cofactor guanylyltransferase [Synergistaceae bacterium]|nr:molybdenum cofactor guanylyltransferase [Synergistaceae bacterium]
MMIDVTAVVLCGGMSKRMQIPKHTLFLNRILPQLQDFRNIALSVRDESQITGFDFPLWPDCVRDCGPLGGILTALKMSETEYVFTIPCDVPNITRSFIAELLGKLKEDDTCLIPVVCGNVQPLTGIYHVSTADPIECALTAGVRSVKSFLDSRKVHYVHFGRESEKIFSNINTKEEYKNWLDENKEVNS